MSDPRRIAVVTTSRADFGIYRPVVRALEARPELDVGWIVSGSHLSKAHGETVSHIESDPAPIWARIPCLTDAAQSPAEVSRAMARAIAGMSETLEDRELDAAVVLGDRFEMFALVAAMTPHRIPVAHLHGGEVTEGALDDSFRHAITKLSHVHFASTDVHARRIRQLGEEPWRIHVSGAPALDAILKIDRRHDGPIAVDGFDCERPFVLAAFHPETTDMDASRQGLTAMLDALDAFGWPVLFTGPNADEGGDEIRATMLDFVRDRPDAAFVESLGVPRFYEVMDRASVMIGNSSSGLIEAPSFGLPVVNIGDRQAGRTRGTNVIDTPNETDRVIEALRRATSDAFASPLGDAENPYGDGHAGPRIAEVLATLPFDDRLITKRFADIAYEFGKDGL